MVSSQSIVVDDKSNVKEYEAVIVGMGPVGLAAAYEIARKNQRVLILENRKKDDAVTRPSIVVVNPSTKAQLLYMIKSDSNLNEKDLKFINDLEESSEVKLSSVQRFIINRINEFNHNNKHRNDGQPLIEMRYETTLENINLKDGTAHLAVTPPAKAGPPSC